MFILMQLVGALLAFALIRYLYPHDPPPVSSRIAANDSETR
jgi:hypothetical protein